MHEDAEGATGMRLSKEVAKDPKVPAGSSCPFIGARTLYNRYTPRQTLLGKKLTS